MRAMEADGGPRQVELPKPQPEKDRLLVRVAAAGVTPLEYTILSSGHPRAKAPLVLGNEGGGDIRRADVDLDDPNFERIPYDPWVAYGRSKTANILFAVEFDRRHKGSGIRATAVHPGIIRTELIRYLAPSILEELVERANPAYIAAGRPALRQKAIPQGAATSVWAGAVASADEVGGRYCEDCQVAEVVVAAADPTIPWGVRAYALDPERAQALWAKSKQMLGERFA